MRHAVVLSSLTLLLSSCSSTYNCSSGDWGKEFSVNDTYIHQYGVTVSKKEWEQRGGNGVVVSTDRSGVTINRSYRAGILEGETSYTFPHSEVIQKTEVYDGGKLVKTVVNYSNGIPRQEEETTRTGFIKRKTWYETGTPSSIELFDGACLVQGEYRNLNNEIVSTVSEAEGERTRWDSYGEPIAVDEIKGGVLVSSTEFYSGGTPKAIVPYLDGFVHGKKKTFYQGGEPKAIETWTRGERTGVTVVFQNGEKSSEVPYKNGKKHGIEKRFRDGEFLAEEITWVQNRRHGPTKIHVASTDRTDWYHQGRLVTQSQYRELNGMEVIN